MQTTPSLRQRMPALLLIAVAALFSIIPLVSMLTAGLARRGTFPQGLSWPTDPQWHNLVDAWTAANMAILLKSSTLIVLGVVPASILLATMAAYAVVILRIPFGGVFVVFLLITLTLPFELVVVPLYYEVKDMGLPSNQLAFIIPAIGLNMPLAVFWMLTHFRSVPADLTEAAQVDGAGPWSAFLRIHLPLAVPHIAALATLLFLATWNSFLLPLVLIPDPRSTQSIDLSAVCRCARPAAGTDPHLRVRCPARRWRRVRRETAGGRRASGRPPVSGHAAWHIHLREACAGGDCRVLP